MHPTFEKLFTGAKVRRNALKFGVGRKTFYEIEPGLVFQKSWLPPVDRSTTGRASFLCSTRRRKFDKSDSSLRSDSSPQTSGSKTGTSLQRISSRGGLVVERRSSFNTWIAFCYDGFESAWRQVPYRL